MPRTGKERANGPYPHGQRWRVVFTGATGVSSTESFESYEQAVKERDAYNAKAGCRTVEEAVKEYIATFSEKSQPTVRYRLYGIFRLKEGDRPLTAISEGEAKKLYGYRVKEVEAATQHGELGYAKRFASWCVTNGWIRSNPFAALKEEGEANRGQPKLRVKATRTYLATLLADDSMEATAVLTALTFSLRASAVTNRLVEDLDDDGQILWVRNNKTRAGDMELEVPGGAPLYLRERLLRLADGKGPKERLFGELTRYGLHYHTVRLCGVAGVDRVTPHGLRGSGATQNLRNGRAIEDVARLLGHNDRGITLNRHYAAPGAVESGNARRIESLVMDAEDSVTNQQNTEVN